MIIHKCVQTHRLFTAFITGGLIMIFCSYQICTCKGDNCLSKSCLSVAAANKSFIVRISTHFIRPSSLLLLIYLFFLQRIHSLGTIAWWFDPLPGCDHQLLLGTSTLSSKVLTVSNLALKTSVCCSVYCSIFLSEAFMVKYWQHFRWQNKLLSSG